MGRHLPKSSSKDCKSAEVYCAIPVCRAQNFRSLGDKISFKTFENTIIIIRVRCVVINLNSTAKPELACIIP